jgi:uncharacterized protein DUF6789
MDTVGRGIVAGFIATLALSGLLDPLVMLTRAVWSPASAFGWLLHFFVAPVIWGAGLAFFHDHVGGPSWLRGVIFATGAWFLIVLVAICFGTGVIAVRLGAGTLAAMLLLHVAYGALLGAIYGGLLQQDMSSSPGLNPVAR